MVFISVSCTSASAAVAMSGIAPARGLLCTCILPNDDEIRAAAAAAAAAWEVEWNVESTCRPRRGRARWAKHRSGGQVARVVAIATAQVGRRKGQGTRAEPRRCYRIR